MSKDLSDLVERFNRNTSLHSKELKKQKKKNRYFIKENIISFY